MTLSDLEDIWMILIPGVEIHEAEICTPVSVGVDTHITLRGGGERNELCNGRDETDYSGARELAKAGEVCSFVNFLAFLRFHEWRSELTT